MKPANPKKTVDTIELLKSCTLFSQLNEEQLEALSKKLKLVSFKRNEVIYLKNDPGNSLYIIRSGRVKISVTNAEGKDLIINIYGRGEVFGEMSVFDGLPRSAGVVALENVEAFLLTKTAFEELLTSVPGLAVNIIALLSRRLRYTTEQTEMLGLFGAYERVALKLLQMAQPDTTGQLIINISQQELAAMLGLTREWLNKVLKALADQGIVELNWGKIVVHKPDALKEWA